MEVSLLQIKSIPILVFAINFVHALTLPFRAICADKIHCNLGETTVTFQLLIILYEANKAPPQKEGRVWP